MRHIVSHKSPDTDSVAGSIVYGNLLNKQGIKAEPVRVGELNKETEYLLNKLKVEAPVLKESLEAGSEVVLIDHNEAGQSINGIEELKVVGVIDHHKFNFTTSNPLFVRAEPLGSSCSIIAKLYAEANVKLEKTEAKLLLAGIISDTLFFRSPTTTEEDRKIVENLNKIAQIESLEDFSLELFDAKSDLGDLSVKEMVKLDYKQFEFNGKNFGIGVMETTNPNFGLDRKDEVIKTLKEIKEKDNLSGIFFSIIDILNEENLSMYADKHDEKLLVELFAATIENGVANLGSLVSRKKQLVPKLQNHFN